MRIALRTTEAIQPRLVGVLLAPLLWVERARGRRRLALVALYLLVLTAASVWFWRATCLIGLPDIGEPFDLERFGTTRVDDADNAYALYRQAGARLHEAGEQHALSSSKAFNITNWPAASAEMRAWAQENQESIALFLRGADRAEALLVQPKDMKAGTFFQSYETLGKLIRLSLLEGSRLQEAGDLEGAWRYYRAALRASQHAMKHGRWMQAWAGHELFQLVRPHITSWTSEQELTAPLLKRALNDVAECASLAPPLSEFIRAEYYALRKQLDDPVFFFSRWGANDQAEAKRWWRQVPVLVSAKRFVNRELERNKRVLQLVVAAQLAQCDRPPEARAGLVAPDLMIYAIDSATPAAVRTIAPEALARWTRSCAISRSLASTNHWNQVESKRTAVERVNVEMAERCYQMEHGFRPRRYADLLGSYLQTLPSGFAPDEVHASP